MFFGRLSFAEDAFAAQGGIAQVDVVVSLTGEQLSTAIGNATVIGNAVVSVTGESLTTVQGTATASGAATVLVTGESLSTTQGTATAVGSAVVSVTGEALTTIIGDETVSGDANVSLTGESLSSTQGSVTVDAGAIVSVTGEEITSTQGSVQVNLPDVTVSLTGEAMSTAIGPYSIVAGGQTTIVVGAETLIETSIGDSVVTGSAVVAVTGEGMRTGLPGDPNEYSAEGSTALSTDEAKFGVSSVEFDGTSGQGVQQNVSSGFASGDFTSEFWIYSSSIRSQNCTLWDFRISGIGLLLTNFNGQISFFKDGSGNSSPTSILTNDTWHHIAIVRSGSTANVYVDGNLQITRSIGTDDYSNHKVLLGNNVFNSSGYLSGYIDEYRDSNIVRYSSNFTPPTSAFTVDDNTYSLLHFDGTDGSTTIVNSAAPEPIIVTGSAVASVTGEALSVAQNSVTVTANANVSVTGESLNTAIGDETVTGSALVTLTGIPLTIVQGTAEGQAGADVPVTGEAISSAQGSVTIEIETVASVTGIEITSTQGGVGVIAWSPVVPGVTNAWTPVDDSNTNTWTEVDDSATNVWTEVDDREVA
jgi:hypothetical protein